MSNVTDSQCHRTQSPSLGTTFQDLSAPFSSFDFIDRHFAASLAIRRCFSLARSNQDCKTLTIEKIGEMGLLLDENDDLRNRGCFTATDIYRLGFWTVPISDNKDFQKVSGDSLYGYAIIKCDGRSQDQARWYVFESVFRKYDHPHNCVSDPATYTVNIGSKLFEIPGVLYCQQNGITKACAHVALRSLLSRILPSRDVSYADINAIAAPLAIGGANYYDPARGLSADQMRAVLNHFGVAYLDIDYTVGEKSPGESPMRKFLPYQKLVYSGVESGYGAMVGFNMPNPNDPLKPFRHIIPFYGHTFNKDTWVSDAEPCYFSFKGGGYIPSESWTSSFIGHDDNFGCNFCVPRLYITPSQADYVIELLHQDVRFNGLKAELAAISILPELVKFLDKENVWQRRLEGAFKSPVAQVILRSVCITPKQYFAHLSQLEDWLGNSEDNRLVEGWASTPSWPAKMWVVEVSLPQLFPANERKIGEIVLDATTDFDMSRKIPALSTLMFARLPGSYFLQDVANASDGGLNLHVWNSCIQSHVPVLRRT